MSCICRQYDVASECIAYYLYFCTDVNATYKAQLDQFRYACSHATNKDGTV